MVSCGAGKPSQMVDVDCKAHVMIDSAEAETGQFGTSLKTTFCLLACTDPAQVGKTITEYFKTEGGGVDALYNVAEAIGQVTHEQRKAAAEASVGMEIDETQWKGKQLCVEIKMEPNMRKNKATGALEINPESPGPFPRIGFRSFGLWSKKAEEVPKDAKYAALVPKTGQQPPAAGATSQAGQPKTTPPAASSNPLGNW